MKNFNLLYAKASEICGEIIIKKGVSRYGQVGCALITKDNNIYTGICLDFACSIGMCAEQSAIAEMLKNHETEIQEILAVNRNGKIYPACGRCRELMIQCNLKNKNTLIYIEQNKAIKLGNLLPERWTDLK